MEVSKNDPIVKNAPKRKTPVISDQLIKDRQERWCTPAEAAIYLDISENEVTDMLNIGYFELSETRKHISKKSLGDYLETGARPRLEEFLRGMRSDIDNEARREKLIKEIADMEDIEGYSISEFKKLKDELKTIPQSKSFDTPAFAKYKGKIFNHSVNVKGYTFVIGDVITPSAVALFETFSKIRPIDYYASDPKDVIIPKN